MSDPARAERFEFLAPAFDPATGTGRLPYRLDDAEPLVETLRFPGAQWPQQPLARQAAEQALQLLHLLAGVSYYKAALPPLIDTGPHQLHAGLARFMEQVWADGLAEFAFCNQLDLRDHIHFPVSISRQEPVVHVPALALPPRALVAMGGGKDSLVSLEGLRAADIALQPVTVGPSSLIGDTVVAAGLSLLRIERSLAPGLLAMNRAGAWNGHVPVTAINSAILTLAAVLYGYRWVVFSNERSAEEATRTTADGRPVNHQYSKTLAFEQAFADTVRAQVAPDLQVFSTLRRLREPEVTRRFAALTQYHAVFSSCNRNFHREGSRIDGRWCGDCPKCRFTTLALAPWLPRAQVVAILGADLLDEPEQEAGFRALCELQADKPFECVGTVQESRALLSALRDHEDWRDALLVQKLAPLVPAQTPALETLLVPGGPHAIPEEILRRADF